MITKEQVIEQMERHGALEIMAHFDTVAINGRAFCDAVAGAQGKKKMRAKFSHGIKAILLLEEYGTAWEAEEAEEAPEAVKIEDSGRKSKHGEAVKQWRAEHPTGSKKGCAGDLGVSLSTVRRHWQIDA